MRTETAGVSEIAKQPTDRQHAHQSDNTNDADWNVALGDWQCVGLTSFTRARSSHRTGKAASHRLYQLQQCPNRRDADRAGADKTHFVLHVFCASAAAAVVTSPAMRRKMRHAPAPADESADQHRDSDRQADQMPDTKKSERQKEIETADRAAAADPECLRDVRCEYLRGYDYRKDR